jgi:hypothetical protein
MVVRRETLLMCINKEKVSQDPRMQVDLLLPDTKQTFFEFLDN